MNSIPFYRKIIFKIYIIITIVLGLSFTLSYLTSIKYTNTLINNSISKEFNNAINTMENFIKFLGQTSQIWVKHSVLDNKLYEKILNEDFKELQNFLEIDKNVNSADTIILLDNNANIISEIGSNYKKGDSLKYQDIVKETFEKKVPLTKITRERESFIVYSSSIIEHENKTLGILLMGYFINDTFLENIKINTSIDIAFIGNSAVMSSTKWGGDKTLDKLPMEYIKYQFLLKDSNKFMNIIHENKEYIISARNLKNLDSSISGSIVVGYPTKNIKSLKNDVFMQTLFIFSSIFGITLIVLFFLSKRLFAPIEILKQSTQKIASGDFSTRVIVKSNNEFKLLAQNFNKMIDAIELKNKQLKDNANKLENANNVKSEFLANMSHEIRTPLNAIMGFVEIVKDNEKDEENIKHLNTVQNSSNLLLTIINDILDFSKMESGKLNIELVKVNPYDNFLKIAELYYQKASAKNIELKTIIDPNLSKCIQIDPIRLTQVINNLLSNAIKFTPENGIIIYKIDYIEKNNSIKISIKDNGIGIKKEIQPRIFNKFIQADSSTTRKYGGTGLGLAISYNLILLMGSKLKLKSKENVGSEFYFTIDLKECNTCIIPQEKTPQNISFSIKKPNKQKKFLILLVEDNKSNQLFMKILLEKLGYNSDIANDGVEAVNKVKQYNKSKRKHYDLIFMDENMPNMNGIEATRQILDYEKENNLEHTPIIALTANALIDDRVKFLDAGMDEYITKPIDKKLLITTLKRFLK